MSCLTKMSSRVRLSRDRRRYDVVEIPPFQADGLLPPGDYEMSFDELRLSVLVVGQVGTAVSPTWDRDWRARLVDNLEVLTRQLWQVGITEVFADGSFAED